MRDPGRTIPRAIFLSALLVCALFVGLHLGMLGTMPWSEIPTEKSATGTCNLAADFVSRIHDRSAPALVNGLLIWSGVCSAFAGFLGYSRIPCGAARNKPFIAPGPGPSGTLDSARGPGPGGQPDNM